MSYRTTLRCLLLAALLLCAAQAQTGFSGPEVKNVILMVPDGMGLADVTAARIRLNGAGGPPLHLESLERVGHVRTYSKTNTITDSSAAASAYACGEKFVNNEVCYHADGARNNLTLLELARSKGMSTGMVVTQTVTHATPAAFAAHTVNRNCETLIASQYIASTRPDVLLGGGQATFKPSAPDVCGATGDYITVAQATGYTYVDTKEKMLQAAGYNTVPLLGLFSAKNLTPEYQRKADTAQPRLPEMTAAALSILEHNPAGFFLLVEGSLIDSGNHEENLDYQLGEIKAFDEAVQVVLDWLDASPGRRDNTLLAILPDHETGGFAVKGVGPKGGELPNAGLGPFEASWTFQLIPSDKVDFESHHTGGDVVIWSQGPGSAPLGRSIDNTAVYFVVRNAMKI
jgi:alkaline phosphatase